MTVETIVPFAGHTEIDDSFLGSGQSYRLRPFDESTLDFLNDVSRVIMNDMLLRSRPEYVALGYWLRKSVLLGIKKENDHMFGNERVRVSPLGTVLHICPANVDTMFLYSLAVSLLMGNRNILRISKRTESPELFRLFAVLNEVLSRPQHAPLAEYVRIVRYDHSDDINTALSMMAACRIIWGGDSTVAAFKSIPTRPRTKDLAFADRISLLALKSSEVISLEGPSLDDFLRKFYNDAYTFDQLGCSSPQTIMFVGSAQENAACMDLLCTQMSSIIESMPATDAASLSGLKINRRVEDSLEGRIHATSGNNLCSFVHANSDIPIESLKGCGGGYFYVREIPSLDESSLPRSPKIQTVTYFGLSPNEKRTLVSASMGEGIDRIVPLGRALEFNYIWDGFNLLDELSKKVQVY